MADNEKGNYYDDAIESVLHSEEEISKRTAELAAQISEKYKGKRLVVVGILKGAFMFMSDLVKRLSIDHRIEFMALSSYGSKTVSDGSVRIIMDIRTSIANEHVLIVEDIVDSGHTLQFLQNLLKTRSPASLSTCVLLSKPSRTKVKVLGDDDFLGFNIPDEWVVGYGLDYDERFRTMPFVGVLKREIYEKPE
uniref:Hypoxanthine phosphoribosyltransferase n=1 Tax=Vannella robusta TaxID=1487602 RepID=A0A7S4M488_9EUKA|mmetsp:Transcript_10549/g.13045  ORF Transcript_10549/g.13045 Transcript_10549/m.13045 type:complete len:193 (+) Transcript_10549:53-631(+)|eukprot:CAMPEP_0206182812 /NCGR_PEP_ID=MMETSP0166-20121206/276_1 /ASSEMBLY_ACC=CAM_ASM_000260 /TAXON_ID=95228 /ORGANISM="Vannella robusta, Strain DIVA3 518/3/11/1/6" /LENGTH=192 /DNA_ID=CAMNT_0053597569 /DNA_START=32 /DNA_END=610 /DNA_ORIENTATION=+